MASEALLYQGRAGLGVEGFLAVAGGSHKQLSRGRVLHLLHHGLWCGLNTHVFCSMVMWKVSLSAQCVRKLRLFGEEVHIGWVSASL